MKIINPDIALRFITHSYFTHRINRINYVWHDEMAHKIGYKIVSSYRIINDYINFINLETRSHVQYIYERKTGQIQKTWE